MKKNRMAWVLAAVLAGSGGSGAAQRRRPDVVSKPMQVVREGNHITVRFDPAVQEAVRKRFPSFRVVRPEDFVTYFVRDIRETYGAPMPYACVADFDGNGLPDVALLLKDRRSRLLLVALHQRRGRQFRTHVVGRWSLSQLRDNEWITDDGKLGCWIHTARGHKVGVHHRWDGIEIDDTGEWAEFFFYYRSGRYRSKFLTPNA